MLDKELEEAGGTFSERAGTPHSTIFVESAHPPAVLPESTRPESAALTQHLRVDPTSQQLRPPTSRR